MQRLLMAVNLAVQVGQFLALAPNIGGDQKEGHRGAENQAKP